MTHLTLIRGGKYWATTTPDPTPVRWPWPFRLALILGAIMWGLMFIGIKALFSQVAPTITLTHGAVTTLVRNGTPEPQHVTVALYVGLGARLDREVRALVAPAAFTLGVSETQTLRLRLHEPFPVGTVLRLLTCFTPASADAPAPGSDTHPVARFV